jgi:hypothetical protein
MHRVLQVRTTTTAKKERESITYDGKVNLLIALPGCLVRHEVDAYRTQAYTSARIVCSKLEQRKHGLLQPTHKRQPPTRFAKPY